MIAADAPARARSTRPGIVVVLLDDMRASDWRVHSKLRALLEGGIWFEQFVLTVPSDRLTERAHRPPDQAIGGGRAREINRPEGV